MWNKDSYLKQLPHFNADIIKRSQERVGASISLFWTICPIPTTCDISLVLRCLDFYHLFVWLRVNNPIKKSSISYFNWTYRFILRVFIETFLDPITYLLYHSFSVDILVNITCWRIDLVILLICQDSISLRWNK